MNALAVLLGLVLLPLAGPRPRPATGSSPCDDLAQTLGGTAAPSGSVCKVNLPRRGLHVTLLGAVLPTGMGLTS